ncbi:TetR/AcrR family transcriptional regulator [Ferroplasma acidarmanus]|uniref:TetR family transcriptional regulator n=1 Tax=Ferroplasma acidarmanus Fer1 TaxID=333146 RepID=S0APQ5_FERAC|nr:helix-turn-helix domain-containing protein [Ferroplasma acidarmanus]AGO60040.1 TetR family transcriptional regulator [Ferroplasma acidarmanus Fer1]
MKELKKDLILESAIKNFAINGYEASMDEIAYDAKVSKGLLFFYYKSKENLIIDAAIKSVPLDVLNYIETKNTVISIRYYMTWVQDF